MKKILITSFILLSFLYTTHVYAEGNIAARNLTSKQAPADIGDIPATDGSNERGDILPGDVPANPPPTTNTGSTVVLNQVVCNGKIENVAQIFGFFTCLISTSIVPLLFTAALAFFFFGVIRYVIAEGNIEKMEEGRWYMVWGIVALFVMVSVWGLVKVLGNTFGVENVIPLLPT